MERWRLVRRKREKWIRKESGLDEEKGNEKEEKELGSQDKFLQC